MLLCVAGFPGSGRNRLSEIVSREMGFAHESFRDLKHRDSIKKLHRTTNVRGTPYADDILMQIYKEVVEEFPIRSRMYPDLIVRDHFCREAPREYLFKEAEKYFGDVHVVWVDATLEESEARLREVVVEQDRFMRRVHLLHELHKLFQPFTRPVLSVSYYKNPEQAVRDTLEYIKKQK